MVYVLYNKELLGLPLEVLREIINAAVRANGIIEAWRLRLVCKTFDREIPAALSATRALEDPVDDPISKGWVSRSTIESYIRHRALVEGKSRPNIYRRLHRVLDEVTGTQDLYCPIRMEAMKTLIFMMVEKCRKSKDIQTLVSVELPSQMSEETFRIDCLQASIALGRTKMLEQDRIREELLARPSWILMGNTDSLFENSLALHATMAGNEELLSEVLTMRRNLACLDTFPLLFINQNDEQIYALKLAIYRRNEGITKTLTSLLPIAKSRRSDESLAEDLTAWAARYGSFEILKMVCVACQMSITSPDIAIAAALRGQQETLGCLINLGFDIDATGTNASYPPTALTAAAKRGRLETVKYLIQQGAGLTRTYDEASIRNAPNEPLLYAARHGHVSLVKFLLTEGAIQNNSKLSSSPLVAAAMNGHADIVALLMDSSRPKSDYDMYLYDKNKHDRRARCDGLQLAAARGFESVVRTMAVRGANLNCGSGIATINASMHGHTHVVKTLLDLGARPVDMKAIGEKLGTSLDLHTRYLGVGVRPMISR